MSSKKSSLPFTWHNQAAPSRQEITKLVEDHTIPFYIAEELLVRTPHPKIVKEEELLYVVLHFPVMNDSPSLETQNEHEVDFLFTKDSLITIHEGKVNSFLQLEKQLEVQKLLSKSKQEVSNTSEMFGMIIDHLYDDIQAHLDSINQSLKIVETRIFEGQQERMIEALSHINRRLLKHQRTLHFHGSILEDLALIEKHPAVGKELSVVSKKLLQRHQHLCSLMTILKDILDDLRETSDLLLNTRINNIMKLLTIIAFVMVPITIVLELMQEVVKDYVHGPSFIFISLGIGLFISLILYIYVKKKKWI